MGVSFFLDEWEWDFGEVAICFVSCVGWVEEVADLKAISITCGESLNTPTTSRFSIRGQRLEVLPEVKIIKRIMDPKKCISRYTSFLNIFGVFLFLYINSGHHLLPQMCLVAPGVVSLL